MLPRRAASTVGNWNHFTVANKMAEQEGLPASSQLIQWLARNKLDWYLQSFIEKGYDDLEEIIQMSDDLLTQLAIDVGMSTKPNHVRRLRGGVATMKAETICHAGDGDEAETSQKSKL